MEDSKEHLNVVIIGHVDAGKSTLTGHLLFELGGLDERTLDKLKEEAKALGKDSFSFAFFMDNKKAERERGITIECNTKEFHTPNYHYSIIDAPGHRDFIKNMISGASQADVAVLMVPANRGGFETSIAKGDHKKNIVTGQTRQHAQLAYLLGIEQIIVCVNKMDDKSIKYDKARYDEISKEVTKMLRSFGYRPKSKSAKIERFPVIPLSGWSGDNLTTKSDKMPWYKGFKYEYGGSVYEGHTLLDALDCVQSPDRKVDAPFRMPVSNVLKIPGIGDVLTGKIEQGTLKTGQEVVFSPSGLTGKVFSIEMHHRNVEQATPGYNIGVNIKGFGKTKLEKPKVGEVMLYKSDTSIQEKVTKFQAMVLVQAHPGKLKCADKDGKGGFTPVLHVRTAKVPCRMLSIEFKKGKSTSGAKVDDPPFVEAGDQAVVWFEPRKPLYVEKFEVCPGLGRIAIMESNSLVMLGKILQVE